MKNKDKKIGFSLNFKDISTKDRKIIKNLTYQPMIWDMTDLKEKVKAFQDKRINENNKILEEMKKDPSLEEKVEEIKKNVYWNNKDTLDDIEYFLKIAGFKQIMKTESVRYSYIKDDDKVSDEDPEVFITAVHPCGVLIRASTFSTNAFGQRRFNSLDVTTQIDLGLGDLNFLSSVSISSGSSSQDIASNGSPIKNTSNRAASSIIEIFNYLDQIQRAGRILEFKDWNTSQFISSIAPHEIIDINHTTYPDIINHNKNNIASKIAQDTFDYLEDTFSGKIGNDLSRVVSNFPGLDNILQSSFFSFFAILPDKSKLVHEINKIAKVRYSKEMEFYENPKRFRDNVNLNERQPYFFKNSFDWMPSEIALLEISRFASHSNIRYLNDEDKKIVSSWIKLIDSATCSSEDKRYRDYSKVNLDKTTFDNANLDKKIEGGLSFPSILLTQAFVNDNAFNLLLQTLATAPKELLEEWCSVSDNSGTTFPLKIIDNATREKNTFLSRSKNGLKVYENLEHLIDFIIKKVGPQNITLTSPKYSPNGLWLKNFNEAIDNRDNPIDFLYFQKILSLFEKRGIEIDTSWRVYLPNRLDRDNVRTLLGSNQMDGEQLEDIIDNFKAINTNPEYSRAILNQILSDTTMSKNGAPKRKI